ncbi:hypothetical protein [Staphylococcus saprophyticus]|nr:hypothetical protein [Staphylococcus saprophyticus]
MCVEIFILSKLMEEKSYGYELKRELCEGIGFDKMSGVNESKV